MQSSKQQVVTSTTTTVNLRSPDGGKGVKKIQQTSKHQQMMDLQASPASRCADSTPQSKQNYISHEQSIINHQTEFVASETPEEAIKIGTWSNESVEDIETYLIGQQRKMVKYRLNIFYLNRCALRIQHGFFRAKALRLQQNKQQIEMQMKLQYQQQEEVLVSSELYQQTQYQSPIHSVVNVSNLSGSETQVGAAASQHTASVGENKQKNQDEVSVKLTQPQQDSQDKGLQRLVEQNDDAEQAYMKISQPTTQSQSQQIVGQIRYREEGIGHEHKATPSFKTTDEGECIAEFDQAKKQTVEQAISQNYISQKRGRKASPFSGQSYPNNEVIDELEEIKQNRPVQAHHQSQRFMGATASSKCRERGSITHSNRGSNEMSQKSQTMSKISSVGGSSTTTTVVTTTTYTNAAGKVLSKSSKSAEKTTAAAKAKQWSSKKSAGGRKTTYNEIAQGSTESLKQGSKATIGSEATKKQSMALKFEKKQIAPIQPSGKKEEEVESQPQSIASSSNFQAQIMSEADHNQILNEVNVDELENIQTVESIYQQPAQPQPQPQPIAPTNQSGNFYQVQEDSLSTLQNKSLARTVVMATLRDQSPPAQVAVKHHYDVGQHRRNGQLLQQSESKVVDNDEVTEINTTVCPEFSFDRTSIINQTISDNSSNVRQDHDTSVKCVASENVANQNSDLTSATMLDCSLLRQQIAIDDVQINQSSVSQDNTMIKPEASHSEHYAEPTTKPVEAVTPKITRQERVTKQQRQAAKLEQQKLQQQPTEGAFRSIDKVKKLDVHFNTQGHYQNKGTITARERSSERVDRMNTSAFTDKNLRSHSQMSGRSTFSMEQKRINSSKKLNSTMIASKSLSRFQERHSRQSRLQTHTVNLDETEQDSPKKSDWKPLQTMTKVKVSDEERRLIRERQMATMSRLQQQTQSSRAKSRLASKSTERLTTQNNDQRTDGDETKTNYSSQKTSIAAVIGKKSRVRTGLKQTNDLADVISPRLTSTIESQATARTHNSRRESHQTPQPMTTRTTRSRLQQVGGTSQTKISTITTSTSRYFVDGKEQKSTVSKKRDQSSKMSAVTPRLKATNSLQQTSFRKVRDMSPQDNSKMTADSSFQRSRGRVVPNQQGRVYQQTISTANKSAVRSTNKETTSTSRAGHAMTQGYPPVSQENPILGDIKKLTSMGETSSAYTSGKKQLSFRQSGQAGGNEIAMQNSNFSDRYPYEQVSVEEVKNFVPDRRIRQKQSSSFNGTSSTSKTRMRLANQRGNAGKQSAHVPAQDDLSSTQKTVTQTLSRGIPSAAQARAAQRRQRDDERVTLEVAGVQSEPQQMEMGMASSKGKDSIHSFASSSSKGVTTIKQVQQQKNSVTSKAASIQNQQQLHSEQHDKSRSQITDDAIFLEQQRFMSEQQLQERQSSEAATNSESLRNFEREEAKVLQETEQYMSGQDSKRLSTSEYDKVVNNMQINQKIVSNRATVKSTSAIKTTRTATTSVMFIKEETKTHINKAFNEDIFFSKIERSFRRDFSSIKEVLQANYTSLVAIYLFYAGQSHAYPAMAVDDFMIFCRETGLVGGQQGLLSDAAIMKCFTLTISQTNGFKKSGEKCLNRYEFLEILVQIAALINKEAANKPKNEGISSTLQVLLTNWVMVNAQRTSRNKFWQMISSDLRVIELLTKNHDVLYSAFKYFTQDKKPRVTLEICVAMARLCQLDVADKLLGVIFAESQQLVIDTMRNQERMFQLTFPEFIYFVCRSTDAHYEDSVYDNEEFWIKLDHMVHLLLDPFDLTPQFQHGAKFMADSQSVTNQQLEVEDVQEAAPVTAHTLIMHKAESTRYSQVTDDLHEVEEDEEVSSMLQGDGLHDGDIQAWPQPCPIAYPQRKDMIVSPAITTDTSQDIGSGVFMEDVSIRQVQQQKSSESAANIGEHEVTVVQQRQRISNASSVLKAATSTHSGGSQNIRTYVKYSTHKQKQ